MNIYEELLHSYALLKKRKLRIISEASNLAPDSETKAKHYAQMAVSMQNTENYIVTIHEFGANAKIFVAKNGKAAGKVVVDNVIGPYPVAVADGAGTPIIGNNWSRFVNKFGRLTDEEPAPEAMPQQDTQMPGQPGMMMPEISETSQNLMDTANIFTSLAGENKFFTMSKSLMAPDWMSPGPMNDFPILQKKIFGPDPFSFESKLAQSASVQELPGTEAKVRVPLHEEEKKLVSSIFKSFAQRIGKLYNNTFSQEDAVWISNRIIKDKNGFCIKDPALIPHGVFLSYRYSIADQNRGFFNHLITTYNKTYENWAKGINIPPNYLIQDTYYDVSKQYPLELNDIRGKSAERLKVAIHSLINGDHEAAALMIKEVAEQYGESLTQSYENALPFMEGYSAADSEIVKSLNSLKELEKYSTGSLTSEVILKILPKLVLFEAQSLLTRKPLGVRHVGTKSGLGFAADIIEFYDSPDTIKDILINSYRFDPMEVQTFNTPNLNIGLKTLMKESDVTLTKTSISHLFTTIVDFQNSPFVRDNAKMFGMLPEANKEYANKLQKITKVLNASFADVNVPGFDGESLRNASMKTLFERISKSAGYEELLALKDIQNIDLDIPFNKEAVKALFERKMMLGLLKKESNLKFEGTLTETAKQWRRFIATTVYTLAGGIQDQIDEIRYFDTGRVYFLNHNKILRDNLRDFINGSVDIDESNFQNLSFVNNISKRKLFKVRMFNLKSKRDSNYISVELYKNFVKMNSKKAVILKTVTESVERILKSIPLP